MIPERTAGRFPRCWRTLQTDRNARPQRDRPALRGRADRFATGAAATASAARPEVRTSSTKADAALNALPQRGTLRCPGTPRRRAASAAPPDAKLPGGTAERQRRWGSRAASGVPAFASLGPMRRARAPYPPPGAARAIPRDANDVLSPAPPVRAALCRALIPEPEGLFYGTHWPLHRSLRASLDVESTRASGSPIRDPHPERPGLRASATIAAPRRRPGHRQPRRSGARGRWRSSVAFTRRPQAAVAKDRSTRSRPGRRWASTGRVTLIPGDTSTHWTFGGRSQTTRCLAIPPSCCAAHWR